MRACARSLRAAPRRRARARTRSRRAAITLSPFLAPSHSRRARRASNSHLGLHARLPLERLLRRWPQGRSRWKGGHMHAHCTRTAHTHYIRTAHTLHTHCTHVGIHALHRWAEAAAERRLRLAVAAGRAVTAVSCTNPSPTPNPSPTLTLTLIHRNPNPNPNSNPNPNQVAAFLSTWLAAWVRGWVRCLCCAAAQRGVVLRRTARAWWRVSHTGSNQRLVDPTQSATCTFILALDSGWPWHARRHSTAHSPRLTVYAPSRYA